ncbi:22978_t:CDS:2, partial [Rhizophagus irregularis]
FSNYVIPVTNTSGVLENYYGDEVLYSNQINAISSLDITIDCLMHMLVYIRESNINEVFSPVVPEDIPSNYLRMSIVIIKEFNNYQGSNFCDYQYSLSNVYEYRILKSVTYWNFKDIIFQTLNVLSGTNTILDLCESSK